MSKPTYKKGEKYILAFVGEGRVQLVESICLGTDGYSYYQFDCGIETILDSYKNIDTQISCFFHTTSNMKITLNSFFITNSFLFMFSSREKVSELLPNIIQKELENLKEKADKIMSSYMKLADEVTGLETYCENIKNNNFTF